MRLLVALDGSPEAEQALAHAIDIADATEGSVTAVHAVDPSTYGEGGTEPITGPSDAEDRLVIESAADAEDHGLEVLEAGTVLAERRGRSIETELLYGEPVRAITDYATEAGVDAIVVGHQGRSERAESMMGSVARGIVNRADLPVTVVR